MVKTYNITDDNGNRHDVKASVRGDWERQTRHHPGATPEVDIKSELPKGITRPEAKRKILEIIEEM